MMPTPDKSFWSGTRVLVTGHTGFKGSWLVHTLTSLGSDVYGLALDPPTVPSHFVESRTSQLLRADHRVDIRKAHEVGSVVADIEPSVIFHLAAQPLVLASYRRPVDTFQINVQGTQNILEAIRRVSSVEAAVIVTSDKVYRNVGPACVFREEDELGGIDPYSASKACVELLVRSYRSSFASSSSARLATVRAGNVIGGGDWAENRLVPDVLRAIDSGGTLKLRYPTALRPWQHVLDPLAGYIAVAEKLASDAGSHREWNFGPDEADIASVGEIAARLFELSKKFVTVSVEDAELAYEATALGVSNSRARQDLQWKPRWDLDMSLRRTWAWHEAWKSERDVRRVTEGQIRDFWSVP